VNPCTFSGQFDVTYRSFVSWHGVYLARRPRCGLPPESAPRRDPHVDRGAWAATVTARLPEGLRRDPNHGRLPRPPAPTGCAAATRAQTVLPRIHVSIAWMPRRRGWWDPAAADTRKLHSAIQNPEEPSHLGWRRGCSTVTPDGCRRSRRDCCSRALEDDPGGGDDPPPTGRHEPPPEFLGREAVDGRSARSGCRGPRHGAHRRVLSAATTADQPRRGGGYSPSRACAASRNDSGSASSSPTCTRQRFAYRPSTASSSS
jgi:hypothetical protein